MTELRTGLNLEDELTAAGDTWAEADAQGRTVERGGQGATAAASSRHRRGVR